ncbi:hypothetical protein [Sphingobium subterraneum]|nr:hypothetical protein [Sphingobium subterraneum]
MNQHEKIAAFLDGQMDDAAMAVFEAEMERDQALADAVARFAGNDALLRDAFKEPLGQGTDDALKARMGLTPLEQNNVDPFPGARKAANENELMLRRWRWPIGGAIAAALTLAVLTQFDGSPQEDRQFADAMETLPSRSVAQLSGGRKIMPVLSFQAGDGRYCREYVRSGGADAGSGIACRTEGGWNVEAQVKGPVKIADGGRIETAAGADPTVLESAYSRLQASDPLNSAIEKRLITNGWKKTAH